MDIIQLTVAAILSAVLALTLKKDSPQFALVISIVTGALLLLAVMPRFTESIGLLARVAAFADGFAHYDILLKVVGIAYATEFGAQICADANESAVASKLELAGRLLILAVSAPLVLSLLEQALFLLP